MFLVITWDKVQYIRSIYKVPAYTERSENMDKKGFVIKSMFLMVWGCQDMAIYRTLVYLPILLSGQPFCHIRTDSWESSVSLPYLLIIFTKPHN